MDAEHIFRAGERGIHLLFDAATIGAAFEADPERLRAVVALRRAELQAVLVEILDLERSDQARALIAALPAELRHVLVLLYFELLERRLLHRRASVH
jgi:hypothetical protein